MTAFLKYPSAVADKKTSSICSPQDMKLIEVEGLPTTEYCLRLYLFGMKEYDEGVHLAAGFVGGVTDPVMLARVGKMFFDSYRSGHDGSPVRTPIGWHLYLRKEIIYPLYEHHLDEFKSWLIKSLTDAHVQRWMVQVINVCPQLDEFASINAFTGADVSLLYDQSTGKLRRGCAEKRECFCEQTPCTYTSTPTSSLDSASSD